MVSVGSQHDMIVNVWDWRNNVKVASNKVSSKVKAVCFAENGNYFVTVGNRHVKFWYLEYSRSAKVSQSDVKVPFLSETNARSLSLFYRTLIDRKVILHGRVVREVEKKERG